MANNCKNLLRRWPCLSSRPRFVCVCSYEYFIKDTIHNFIACILDWIGIPFMHFMQKSKIQFLQFILSYFEHSIVYFKHEKWHICYCNTSIRSIKSYYIEWNKFCFDSWTFCKSNKKWNGKRNAWMHYSYYYYYELRAWTRLQFRDLLCSNCYCNV